MKTNRNLKTVRLSRCNIECHADAKNAFIHSKNIKTNANSNARFSASATAEDVEFVRENQQINPLVCIKISAGELRFFSGWGWFQHCLLMGIDDIEIIEFRTSTGINFEKYAWQYLLSKHVFDMQKTVSLAQWVNLIEAIPSSLKPQLLSSNYSRSAQMAVQYITGCSRESVRWAIKNSMRPENETQSVFEQLLR
ncbi:hypothetical protein [Aliiglaciecola lipolytica]|uniref:Uncharacterized protein n=1 Tax=Aliiglaciecola lipolytica E3 TaxID=1127673 RepID=K6XS34_9ALTE|nr:hypothetical protein [Aliiglaciecola lipolytica]GAC14491.1 hypothetical protein GLIP_1863 [Aliiglaciecola lipolytica E3]